MATIIITLEDKENGQVKVQCTPNMQSLAQMQLSGNDLTPACGFALTAVNALLKAHREQEQKSRIQTLAPGFQV